MSVAAPARLLLPTADGRLEPFAASSPPAHPHDGRPARTRVAYAAVHVVADPLATGDPIDSAALDWEATLAYRRHLWSYGLGVAEAMDTAQRGMGLDWPLARELIARSGAEARAVGGQISCGIATDQLPAGAPATLAEIRDAYLAQLEIVESEQATAVVMASRALVATATAPDDYRAVYDELLDQASRPVILHWLGEMFDPALAGYWGAADPADAVDLVCELIADNAERVDGIKVSLLDPEFEVELRRMLPPGVRMYTGDDFNYPSLIRGDEQGHSDALLGILDAIAPPAAAALAALDAGEMARYESLLAPTLPFARHVFEAPTRHYKTGLTLLAYLNGHQSHFRMVGGCEANRTITHLAELVRLADASGLLADHELAMARMAVVLELAGIEQQ